MLVFEAKNIELKNSLYKSNELVGKAQNKIIDKDVKVRHTYRAPGVGCPQQEEITSWRVGKEISVLWQRYCVCRPWREVSLEAF